MTDADLQPSPDALAILRKAGWSPERSADVSEWLAALVRDGNAVVGGPRLPAAVAQSILDECAGLLLGWRISSVTGRGTWLTDPQALSQQIASINSRLRELWDDHIRENDGVPLPHLYLGEIASWFVEPAERGVPLDDDRRALCTLLDKALHEGDGDVRELIQVSFVENLPLNASQWFLPCFGSALTDDFARYSGCAG